MWKQDSDVLRQAASLQPQQSLGLTASGLPSVEALLASTAKLMGRTSNLERTGSKMSSLSQPTTQGSQDLMDKLTHFQNERLERRPSAPGFGRIQPSRLTYPSWVCTPDSPRSASERDSPLIRAGLPNLFDTHGRHHGSDARQETPAGKETGSSSTPHAGQALRSRPKKLQSQLKKLASSIVALRESISTQAPGRSRTKTRIPVPRLAAATDRPASAQHRGSRCPDGKSALTAEAPPDGLTIREETEVSDWDDDDKAQECWTEQVHPPAAETVAQEEASMRSPAVPVDSKIPTAAEARQASDPAPAVSALFDSLWDTDDEKSSAQPPKQAQAKRARSGIHKKSAESGTLDRKMRSLEAVWSSILDYKGKSDGGLRLSEDQPPAVAELQPASVSAMQVGRRTQAPAAQEEYTKSSERATLDGKLQSLQPAGQQTSDAQPSSMLAAVLAPDCNKLDNKSMCFTADRRPQRLAVSALLPAVGRQAIAGSASRTGEVAACTEPATQQVECLNGTASMPMQPAEESATWDAEDAVVAEHVPAASWAVLQQSGSAVAAPSQQMSVDATPQNPQLRAEDVAESHVPAADSMPQQQPSTIPTVHPSLQPLDSQPPQQQRPAQETITQSGLTAAQAQEQLMQQAPQTVCITAPVSTLDGNVALPRTYERIELPLPHVQKRGLRKLKFWKSKSQTGTSDSSLAKGRAQRIASESGRVGSLEPAAGSKDSFTRLGSLFRRRSFSAVATAPGQPAFQRPSAARPASVSQVLAESPRMRHAGPPCASQLSAHAMAQEPETNQGSTHVRTADASSGSDKVAALDDQLARKSVENCDDSAQGWASKEDAVKELPVPASVPCKLGVTGVQLADTAAPAPEGPPATDPAAAATATVVEPQCTQTDFRVNTEQWLSNEKAQKGLLVPTWVPSKLPITATSPLSDMPRPDGETPLGTIPSATESRAAAAQAGEEEEWLSPERAVKSLLVPSWVPSKLPISASPPAPEGSSQGDATPNDLIAAVSPRPSTLTPRAARLDWKASKAPVSVMPVSSGPAASSRSHQAPSLPWALQEEAVLDQSGNNIATQPPSLPRQAFSLQPADLAPVASVPAPAEHFRPMTTALSLQNARPLPQRLGPLGQDSATAAQELGQGKAKREGFFKALFRRRTESLERTKRSASPERPVDRRQSESQAGTGSHVSLNMLPPIVAQPLPFRHSEPGTAFQGLAAAPAVLSEAAVEELVDTRAASLTFSGASVTGQPAQGLHSATELGAQTEFSFHVAPLTGRSATSERSRTPSAGRRRVTDEDLDDLRARFSRLEQTFVNLPPRTPSRERKRHRAQPPGPHRLHQVDVFEAAAGNPRPMPASSTGTAEAVPFIMQKLPLPDAEQTKFTDRFSQPAKEHLPASLTTQRWVESLRAPEPTRAASSRSSPVARAPRQDPKPVPSAAEKTAPVAQRSVSPFGRVQCGPERPVPFLITHRGPAAHLEDDGTAESPTTQLEKQLKHAAGADSPRNESPQWRLVAEHIVKSSEVGELKRHPHLTEPKPESEAAVADRKDNSLDRLFGEDGIANGTVDRLRFWTEQQAAARPDKQQQQQQRASPSGGSPPRIVSPQRRGPEPVLVESTRPAFPALKAYLGAKSPRRLPQKPSAEDPELAACRGVSALQRRFESGLLLESNVAALQKQFENRTQPRERTAAWADEHAQKAAQVPSLGSRPIINMRASS